MDVADVRVVVEELLEGKVVSRKLCGCFAFLILHADDRWTCPNVSKKQFGRRNWAGPGLSGFKNDDEGLVAAMKALLGSSAGCTRAALLGVLRLVTDDVRTILGGGGGGDGHIQALLDEAVLLQPCTIH